MTAHKPDDPKPRRRDSFLAGVILSFLISRLAAQTDHLGPSLSQIGTTVGRVLWIWPLAAAWLVWAALIIERLGSRVDRADLRSVAERQVRGTIVLVLLSMIAAIGMDGDNGAWIFAATAAGCIAIDVAMAKSLRLAAAMGTTGFKGLAGWFGSLSPLRHRAVSTEVVVGLTVFLLTTIVATAGTAVAVVEISNHLPLRRASDPIVAPGPLTKPAKPSGSTVVTTTLPTDTVTASGQPAVAMRGFPDLTG